MFAQMITERFLKRLDHIAYGTLSLTTPDGKMRVFEGAQAGEHADLVLHDWQVIPNMLRHGDIAFAEDYRRGLWASNDLVALVSVGLMNRNALDRLIAGHPLSRLLSGLSYLLKINSVKGSRRNIHAHYDLGNEFYKLWLDPSMTYSAAIFDDPNESLEQAQHRKYDRILNCLNQKSGSLLEVGCGWGGFAERAQERGDFGLKGLTLSTEQHDYAQQRLGNKANIALEDYRHQDTKFDNIVSIEMFEAVGERYWQTYFQKIGSLLNQGGKAVIQTITMNEKDFPRYRRGGDFIRSYIFPGGMLPSPSRFDAEAAKASLKTQNSYSFGHDYARTLEHWLERFDAQKSKIQALGFDDGFIRLWRFYLAACIAGFKTDRTDVIQVELSHV